MFRKLAVLVLVIATIAAALAAEKANTERQRRGYSTYLGTGDFGYHEGYGGYPSLYSGYGYGGYPSLYSGYGYSGYPSFHGSYLGYSGLHGGYHHGLY